MICWLTPKLNRVFTPVGDFAGSSHRHLTVTSPQPQFIMGFGFRRFGVGSPGKSQRIAEVNLLATTRTGSGSVDHLLGNIDADVALRANQAAGCFSNPLIARSPRRADRFLTRGTMHQNACHLRGEHDPLFTPGTLMNTQSRRDGNRRVTIGTLDRQVSARLIDNEMIIADRTFEEDIGHGCLANQ